MTLFTTEWTDGFQLFTTQLAIDFSLSLELALAGGADSLLNLLVALTFTFALGLSCMACLLLVEQLMVFDGGDLHLQIDAV